MSLEAFRIMSTNPKMKVWVWANTLLAAYQRTASRGRWIWFRPLQSLPPKPSELTLAFVCLREHPGAALGQFQFSIPRMVQEPCFLRLNSLQLYTQAEGLGCQPHSPLPTLCAIAHASTYFVARHPCRRLAGKD